MSQMLRSSGVIGLATFASRLLGLVREQAYAHFMGDGPVASAFKLAFQVPNLFRRLLGEGALTAAFIPIFKDKEKTAGEAEMWRSANAVISGLVVATLALVGVVVLGLTLLLTLSAVRTTPAGTPVYPPFPIPILHEDTRLMLRLLRWMFPYVLLVCLAALGMGMLNARGHFFIPAMGATMLNVVMIATVLLVAPRFGATLETQIFALAVGVLVAGGAQFLFQVPTLWKEGFRYRWISPWRDETVREVVRKMAPAALGVAAFQINVLLIQGLAFWVDRWVVASFDYAVRLLEFPQGIVGASLATYLLPTLAGLAAEKRYGEFCANLREGLSHLLFINLLAAALLLVLAEPIVRLLFERGEFQAGATRRAALALACLAPSLVAYSTVNVLARAFYALGDTQTPMKVSVVCLGVNLAFAAILLGPLRQGGLGLANTLSSALNAWLLLHALRRKLSRLQLGQLRKQVLPLLGLTALAASTAFMCLRVWEGRLGHADLASRLGAVFVPMLAASVVYWGLALVCRVPQAQAIGTALYHRFRAGAEPPERTG
jgi:putative peptidoglycan lipid II flippase